MTSKLTPLCPHCGQTMPATAESILVYQRVWQRTKYKALKDGRTDSAAKRLARIEARAAKAAVLRGEVQP